MASCKSALSSTAPLSWLSGIVTAVKDEGADVLADDFRRFAVLVISGPGVDPAVSRVRKVEEVKNHLFAS
jgi:hypothetical protein